MTRMPNPDGCIRVSKSNGIYSVTQTRMATTVCDGWLFKLIELVVRGLENVLYIKHIWLFKHSFNTLN